MIYSNKQFGIITLAVIISIGFAAMSLTGCEQEGSEGGRTLHTPRYQTVPYSQAAGSGNAGYEVMISAYDDTHYYYVLYLGYINRVPILFRDAVLWNGAPASGLTVGFSREEATEEMVSNSIMIASSETVSKAQELNYGLTLGMEASAKGGFLGIAEVGWKASVSATVGGSTTWGSEASRSRESTVETATTKSTGTTDSLEFTVMGDDPHGKYRYTLFGTTDVYIVMQTNKDPQTMADITDSYISFCGRPDTFAWGVDYEPDENGTFKKNVSSNLLELPDLDFSSLVIPTTPVAEVQIPKPAAPTADPPGSTYVSAVSVTLSSVNTDSKIYYTTNNSEPTASSTLYTGPVTVSSSCVLKAVAIRDGAPASDVMTETYTITPGRQQEYFRQTYTISRANGGTVTKVQGDGNIDSKPGKNTDWDVDVSLAPRGNNAVATVTYHVREKGGDNSILKLTQEITIPLNKSDIRIEYPYNQYFVSGTITGQQHGGVWKLNPHDPVGGPIYSLRVWIDGSGSDEGNIKVELTLGFNYTHQP
ncbi:MAG: chitobiase/beta-hexosaminidase C-terminal domain-containing protein [Treponema sp.]|nr:chitobiase/beta-hexosaminidase C-terminal domain-containing protein [Treponema sp.]